jgi:photosystem II stability/assembly factor-like uncharacterized protein
VISLRSVARVVWLAALSTALGGLAATLSGQSPVRPAVLPFDRLQFREIGPATPSGRIDDFAVLERDPATFYVATATGGLWKTVNNGTTFESVFDNEATSSIGDAAIAPADANLVWVGTGENNNRQSSSWGGGVFKSTDGGKSWKNMGLADSKHIARIIVDPIDHDVVYVAALGSLWGAGGERGVYKTTDGGLTWTRLLHVDDETGATELVMDSSNNKVLYAATYQRRRATWGMNGGGPGSGVYKSTDAGRSWTRLTKGLPEGPMGRIGLDVYRKDPNVVYARIEHAKEAGVYRSNDGGMTWTKMSSVNPRPMYFSQIRIDPADDHRIYVLGVQLHVSDDAGKTFRSDGARNIHVDFHAMWVDPSNPNHLMIGGDGGVGISYDRSRTYVWLNNLPVGQFYHTAYDMRTPYYVCGGLQDNNTWCGPSAVRTASGIANDDWFIIGGGDGFVAQIDPSDHHVLYAESQDGRMNRVDLTTNERKSIRPEAPDGEPPYRWNWDTPMAISAHDPAIVFVAANRVFRSTDRGHSWKAISPDLTTNTDRETLSLMGVAAKDFTLAKHDGVGAYGTLVTFGESPKREGVYYAGSDDGVVSVSRDGGATWSNVTSKVPGLPKNTYVSRLAPSRFEDATVYATFDGHRLNDFGTYVYLSADYGATWRSIAGDLPKGQVARTITEDQKNPDVLYLGTEAGLFVTVDRGRKWMRVKANLPTVPVYEIALHPRDNDMILATHGRSLWILDDLAPFQQFAKASGADAFIFDPPPATEQNRANDRMKSFEGDRLFLGKNPEAGAALTWYLKAGAKEVRWTIRDRSGAVVRELSGDSVKEKNGAGVNTVNWDLRVAPLPQPKVQQGGGGGFFGAGLNGPFVLPGPYRATLSVDGREAGSTSVVVSGDPGIRITDADRRTHFETARALHALHRTVNEAADAVAALHDQVTVVQNTLKEARDVPASVGSTADDLSKQIGALRPRLGLGGGGFGFGPENVRGRIAGLKGAVMASTSLPTETQTRQLGDVRHALTKVVDEANVVIARVGAFYRDLAERNLYPGAPAPIPPIGR